MALIFTSLTIGCAGDDPASDDASAVGNGPNGAGGDNQGAAGGGNPEPAGGAGAPAPEGNGGAPSPAGTETPEDPSPGPSGAVGEECPRDERVGSFRLYLGDDRTIFAGAVSDGVAPAAIPEVVAEEGGCQLLGPRNLFCSESCASGTTCAGDDQCVPTPMKVSAGSVAVSGLATELTADPNGITGDYSKTLQEPFPAFEPGAALTLSAAGDVVGAFSLDAYGVAAMTTELGMVPVSKGSPVTLTWDASPADPSQAAVYVGFTVNAHGAVTGWIECTAPDTGSFDIPATLVSQLIDLGLSGFPRATLGRRSTDTTTTSAGCVDFSVSSEVTLDLEVDGLVSCNTDDDCPDAQTCSPVLACE